MSFSRQRHGTRPFPEHTPHSTGCSSAPHAPPTPRANFSTNARYLCAAAAPWTNTEPHFFIRETSSEALPSTCSTLQHRTRQVRWAIVLAEHRHCNKGNSAVRKRDRVQSERLRQAVCVCVLTVQYRSLAGVAQASRAHGEPHRGAAPRVVASHTTPRLVFRPLPHRPWAHHSDRDYDDARPRIVLLRGPSGSFGSQQQGPPPATTLSRQIPLLY